MTQSQQGSVTWSPAEGRTQCWTLQAPLTT
jgi:hypothetical protein